MQQVTHTTYDVRKPMGLLLHHMSMHTVTAWGTASHWQQG
jgi:hypothetical protein